MNINMMVNITPGDPILVGGARQEVESIWEDGIILSNGDWINFSKITAMRLPDGDILITPATMRLVE